jgi:hypothetical protein
MAYPDFHAAAISRRDGSPHDGVHLLWTAPPRAGYSVHGFDIQRREREKRRVVCHTLSQQELAVLHQLFRVEIPFGSVAVARAPCPGLPDPVPDDPIDPTEEPGDRVCVDFAEDDFPVAPRGVFGPVTATVVAPSSGPARIRTVGAVRGLDCGVRLEVALPSTATFVEASVVPFAGPVKLLAVNAAGDVVGAAPTSGGGGQPETLLVRASGIVKVVFEVPSNEALLLRLCFGTDAKPQMQCVELGDLKLGEHTNPLSTTLADVLVLGPGGTPHRRTRIKTIATYTGLDCGHESRVRLRRPASAVRLTLVTFASKLRIEALEEDGSLADAASVTRNGRPQSVTLTGKRLTGLRVHAPQNEAMLLSICVGAKRLVRDILAVTAERRPPARPTFFAAGAGALDFSTTGAAASRPTPSRADSDPRSRAGAGANAADTDGTSIAAPRSTVSVVAATAPTGCIRYRVTLQRAHNLVQVTAHTTPVLVIALRDGKAVDSRLVDHPSGVQTVSFEGRAADEIAIYGSRAVSALTICVDQPKSFDEEEKEWAAVPFIARGIQLPLRTVNSAVSTDAQEVDLARSRLIGGESIETADFRDIARMMNEAVSVGPGAPVVHTLQVRDTVDDPYLELRPWPFAQAAMADAAWRRALGFAWLDKATGLTAGTSYDYRITGHFRRRDVEHDLFGFHLVPNGTTLPRVFQIGPVHFRLPGRRVVRPHPAPPATAVRSNGRLGLPLQPFGLAGRSLTLSFDTPVSRVVLELEPTLGGSLSWVAHTPDALLGFGGSTFSGSFAVSARVTLDFAEPVDTLELRGTGLLYGVRRADPASGDGDGVVRRSVVVPAVRFVDTPAPAPPPLLGTTNLQEPLIPGDPAVTTKRPPQALGFELSWLPPPASTGPSPGPMPWPTDLGTFPPFDVLGFHLERRQVDTSGAFEEVSDGPGPMLFFGNRSGRQRLDQVYWGSDLDELFSESFTSAIEGANPYMTAEDVLRGPDDPLGPRPGSTFQYRIFSVDAIGRRSASATTGSVVRLEKHIAPPQPPGPPPSAPARLEPSGVRARVLQASDPDLTPEDATLLASSTNAIVLEWGWTDAERARDPFATEFRIYWQPVPPDVLEGTLKGPATLVGGTWRMTADLNQQVAADALVGKYVRAADHPFKIAGNAAGRLGIEVRLEPSALEPSTTPAGAPFVTRPLLTGAELRPSRWAERTAVVPIGAGPPSAFVFRDRLTLGPDRPNARVWVGVSTADAEGYVADELPGSAPSGGRVGNESSIAAAVAEARYLGRPTFIPPPPLAIVPEVVSSEPVGESVMVELDLPALLPTVVLPAGHEFVMERLAVSDLLRTISRPGDGSIGVTFPDRSTASYTLANASDQASLLAQIGTGEGARVEGRFVLDLLRRFPAKYEALWALAAAEPIPFTSRQVRLPADAERFLFRLRLSDSAGHRSNEAAIVPRIVRAMSTRAPGAPRTEAPKSDTDAVTATVRVVDAFDLRWALLFSLAEDATVPLDDRLTAEATLLRLPNRRDLYPDHGIRLRLGDGTLLEPTAVDLRAHGAPDPPDLIAALDLAADYDQRVSVWTVAMTRDGIPSRPTGPVTATTGPRPLVVPALTVSTTGGEDTASWGVPTEPAEFRLERSVDGGATWTRVSPWLPSSTTDFALPGSGPRTYRLVLRGRRGQTAVGPPVALA